MQNCHHKQMFPSHTERNDNSLSMLGKITGHYRELYNIVMVDVIVSVLVYVVIPF